MIEGMKKVIIKSALGIIAFLTWLRYRVKLVGLDALQKRDPQGGFLFLPNHPTLLIDPTIITTTIMKKMELRPVVVDYMYYLKIPNLILRQIKAVAIPSFANTTNTHKLRRMDRALNELVKGLDRGENFLFYPSGKIKLTAREQIGATSGLHKILQESKHCNVVLVRITGLWGSSFSKAHPDHSSGMTSNVLHGIKSTLKNLIFFNPRRNITLEFVNAPADFPYQESRSVQNRWLENWYNQSEEGEKPYFVPYSIWSKEKVTEVAPPKREEVEVDLNQVPPALQEKIYQKLSEMSDIPAQEINPSMDLAIDMGLDSLDASELTVFLEELCDVKNIPGEALTTVKKVLGVASKQIQPEGGEEEKVNLSKWKVPAEAKPIQFPQGKTLEEAFLHTACRMRKSVCCADERLGVLTYQDMLVRIFLLADKFQTLPGEKVGILLPSSVGAMILFFALRLAGKIPVLVNWTTGPRHVNAVVESTQLKVCLSSWAFLDRLPNVDIGHLVEILVQLEDLGETIALKDKLRALRRSKKSLRSLLDLFKLDAKSAEDPAVILFTSGSEGNPKGVPLSHRNILSNLDAIIRAIKFYENDVFVSILPPFHSFGFTICGMAPLLFGVKAVFFPNPTESSKIARGIAKWKATILCGAPSFLKNIFKAAQKEQLRSLRLAVTGAEKASEELYRMSEKAGIPESLLEGYGITECAPVLTLNYPGEERKGVGRPLPNVELELIHPETHEKVGVNQQGLILATGPNIFSGYLNSSLNPFIEREGKRWYVTGDLGILDEKGRLQITGRLKRFIKVGPEMVSLGAIEEAFAEQKEKLGAFNEEHGPFLAACAKEFPGEKPKFYLFTTFPLTVERANVLLNEMGFSNLVRIHQVSQLSKMPLMGSGKVNYQALEKDYLK